MGGEDGLGDSQLAEAVNVVRKRGPLLGHAPDGEGGQQDDGEGQNGQTVRARVR